MATQQRSTGAMTKTWIGLTVLLVGAAAIAYYLGRPPAKARGFKPSTSPSSTTPRTQLPFVSLAALSSRTGFQ